MPIPVSRLFFSVIGLLLILLSTTSNAQLIITEVMYNPPQNESYSEWLEIFNPGNEAVSLENWTVCNNSLLPGYIDHTDNNTYFNDTFDLLPLSFAVITDGGSGTLAYSQYNISGLAFHTNSSYICSGLNNDNETIDLSATNYTESLYYNSSMGAYGNNKTLCRFPENNSSLQECVPTPGRMNKLKPVFTITTPSQMSIGQNYTLFNISSTSDTQIGFWYNLDNGTENRSETGSYNITGYLEIGRFQPSSASPVVLYWNLTSAYENISSCVDISVLSSACVVNMSIAAPAVWNASQQLEYFLELKDSACVDKNISIEYWIEDLFGKIVKEKTTTERDFSCQKSISRTWTPPDILGSEAYIIISRIVNASCAVESSIAEHYIAVKGSQKSDASYINILGHDSSASFGSVIYAELEIYKGDTNRYAVDIWVEKASKKSSLVTTVHAKEEYTKYVINVPIKIKDNCDGSLQSGTHMLLVSGLDTQDSESIAIEGVSGSCPVTVTTASSSGSSSSFSSSQVKTNDTINVDIVLYNESAYPGDELVTRVNITNMFNTKKNITIYSYVFKGSYPANEGGWTPNYVNITLNSSQTMTLALRNTIKNDANEGLYYLRVRARTDRTYDKTAEIMINKPQEVDENAVEKLVEGSKSKSLENKSMEIKENRTAQISATAMATAAEKKNTLGIYLLRILLLSRLFHAQ